MHAGNKDDLNIGFIITENLVYDFIDFTMGKLQTLHCQNKDVHFNQISEYLKSHE